MAGPLCSGGSCIQCVAGLAEWPTGVDTADPDCCEPNTAAAASDRFGISSTTCQEGDLNRALIRAMIGAARADGEIDAQEQQRIFGQVEAPGLDNVIGMHLFRVDTVPRGACWGISAVPGMTRSTILFTSGSIPMDGNLCRRCTRAVCSRRIYQGESDRLLLRVLVGQPACKLHQYPG